MTLSRLEINLDKQDRLNSSIYSKGDQPKWFKDGYWIKANSFGYEDLAETVASDILKMSDIKTPYLEYRLCKIIEDGKELNGCISKNFLNTDECIVTFGRLLTKYGINYDKLMKNKSTKEKVISLIDTLRDITSLDLTQYLKDTLALDAIILNEDRHLNNLAIIYDVKTDRFRECPIFDNGLSLLSDTINFSTYTSVSILRNKVKAKPFASSFDKQFETLGCDFKIDKNMLTAYMEENREQLGRVYALLKYSMSNYKEVFR